MVRAGQGFSLSLWGKGSVTRADTVTPIPDGLQARADPDPADLMLGPEYCRSQELSLQAQSQDFSQWEVEGSRGKN